MYQITTYCIYLLISSFITIYVGWRCYIHGIVWLNKLLNSEQISLAVNRILLICYYLVNVGYIIWSLSTWKVIENPIDMMNALAFKIGGITLILSVLHYLNIATIFFFSKRIIHSKNQIS